MRAKLKHFFKEKIVWMGVHELEWSYGEISFQQFESFCSIFVPLVNHVKCATTFE